jgi:cation transport ATPase
MFDYLHKLRGFLSKRRIFVKIKFQVTGMTCAACSARVEKVTRAVPGVEAADVNLLAGSMQVEAASADVTDAIIQAVTNAGYGASVPGEKRVQKQEQKTAE